MIAMSDFSASSIRLVICFRILRFKLHFTTQSGYLGFRSGVPHIPNPVPIINGDKIMSQTILPIHSRETHVMIYKNI